MSFWLLFDNMVSILLQFNTNTPATYFERSAAKVKYTRSLGILCECVTASLDKGTVMLCSHSVYFVRPNVVPSRGLSKADLEETVASTILG